MYIYYLKYTLNFETYLKNKKEKYDRSKLDKLLKRSIEDYKLFFKYLLSIKANHVIKFENLLINPERSLINLFHFYNLKYEKKTFKKIYINKQKILKTNLFRFKKYK